MAACVCKMKAAQCSACNSFNNICWSGTAYTASRASACASLNCNKACNGSAVPVLPKEFELLSLLARNHDRVLTHRTILKAIWGANAVEQTEHLWTLVAQLRKKVEPDPANPQYILSEPWVGYRFSTGEPDPAK